MNSCANCGAPIVPGKEVWTRRRSTNERVAICPDCAAAIRQAGKSQPQRAVTPTPVQEATPLMATAGPTAASTWAKPNPIASEPLALKSKTYRPSEIVPIEGMVLLLGFALAAGLVGGLITFAVSRLVYLIIAFPAVMGLMGGYAVAAAVKAGKVRFPLMAALVGIMAGLLVYGVYWYGDYLAFRSEARSILEAEFQAELLANPDVSANQLVNFLLEEETGMGGFLGYVLLTAREGVSIGRVGVDGGINLGRLTWLYWLAEVVIIAWVAGRQSWEAAYEPFCEKHNRWYGRPQAIGAVAQGGSSEALQLVHNGGFGRLRQLLHPQIAPPSVEFAVQSCQHCQESAPMLIVTDISKNYKGRVERKERLKQLISPAEYAELVL